MEELLKNSTVRSKIQGLCPPVKKAFIESLLDLYEQETEEMIDVIEESRMELRGDYRSFQDETQNLRAESRMLEDKRKDHDNQCVDRYVQSRASRASESRMSYLDENSKAVKDYVRKRGKKGPPLAEEIKRSQSSQSSADRYTSKPRSDSVMTTRSLPTPATLRTVEEEKDEVMKNLTSANQQNEVERQRQAELIAQRREKRRMEKKTTEEKALELLEKAVAMDKMLQERKQEQEQQVRQRLEDAKRKRAESRLGGSLSRADTTIDSKEMRDDRKDEKKSEDKKKRSDGRSDDKQKQRSSESQDKEKHRSRDSDSRDENKHARKTSESRSDDKEKRRSSETRDDKHGASDKRSSEKKSDGRSTTSDKNSEKRHSSGKSDRRDKDKGKESDKKKETVNDYDFSIY